MADLVLLQTFIAGYSALLQTIQVWQSTRNRHQARDAFDIAIELSKHRHVIETQARALSPLVPQDIANLIARRFSGCWTQYSLILDPASSASDEAVDAAELEMIKCACREAKRLYDLTAGNIPPGPLLDFWNTHRCWEEPPK